MSELWRSVSDCPGYEVSNRGRVRSLDRLGSDGRKLRGRVLQGSLCGSSGKRLVVRMHHQDGSVTSRYVHTLVLETFIEPRPPGGVARHLDDNGENNAVENLRWGTVSENNHDLVANGKHANANKTHCPKGHPYSIRWGESGGRRCQECEVARAARRKEEQMTKRKQGAQG